MSFLYRVCRRPEGVADAEWQPCSKRTGGKPHTYATLGVAKQVKTTLERNANRALSRPRYEYRVEQMPQTGWVPVGDES